MQTPRSECKPRVRSANTYVRMVAQECTSTSHPQQDRGCTAFCPHYVRTTPIVFPQHLGNLSALLLLRCLSAQFPRHLQSLSALFPRYLPSLSALFPRYLRTVAAVLPHCSRGISALLPQSFRCLLLVRNCIITTQQSVPYV